MSDFYVGQEVVCVNDQLMTPGLIWEFPLRAGTHYRICWIGEYRYGLGGKKLAVRLDGVKRAGGLGDVPFFIARFAPIKSESIQIFRDMCINVKRNIDA